MDVDPRNGGVKTLKRLEAKFGSLRDTTTAVTGGGGRHFIFSCLGFAVRKRALGPGIDVLSDGNYIVVPPSNHVSGRVYSWAAGRNPAQKPPQQLPAGYHRLLRVTSVTRVTMANDSAHAGAKTDTHRNVTLTSVGGKLRRAGLTEETIRAALMEENRKFHPPLDRAEVEKIVASLLRYPAAPDNANDDPSFEFMERVLAADFAGGAHLMFLSGTFWRFKSSHWSQTADEAIQQNVLSAIRLGGVPKGYRPHAFSRDVLSLLKARTLRDDDPLRFQATPLPIINCRNGEVWLDAKGNPALKPHSPSSGLRCCLEVDYDPSAQCPEYDRALLEIFAKSGAPEPMADFWNMISGYVIQPTRRHPLISVLWGVGSNGKSSLKDTLIRLLGADLVYAGQAHRLSEGRFTSGDLFGKLLFVDDDVPAGVKLPDGELKIISEEKLLTGEQKYRPSFNFICRTAPLLLCNNVPSLADLSYGMLRRLIVIPFDRRFEENEIDLSLFPTIWRKEMSGILNRALEGYARLVQHGRFIIPAPVRAAKTSWLRHANPVTAFLNEECKLDRPGRTLLAALYVAFCDWAKAAGITRVQQRLTFKRNLEFIGFQIIRTSRGEAVLGLVVRGNLNSPMTRPTP